RGGCRRGRGPRAAAPPPRRARRRRARARPGAACGASRAGTLSRPRCPRAAAFASVRRVPRPRRPRPRARPLPFVVLLALACASPVGVTREDPTRVHRELTANVLSAGRPSDRTYQVLDRYGLRERFEKEPEAVLAQLHAGLQPTGDHRRLSALAELSFYHGERSHDSRYLLAAAIYAYALLFPGPGGKTLDASDPRVRLAYDLYNRGLTAVASENAGKGRRLLPLPFGELELEFDPSDLDWAGHRLENFVDAANYAVRG